MELARTGLRSAENALLPDLRLSAQADHRGGHNGTHWSGGLKLTVQLKDDGPRRALIRARHNLRRAEMVLAERHRSIRIEVCRAVHDVAEALSQIDLSHQARELAGHKLDVERRKLQLVLSSAFQLGRFEGDLVAAQRRELDAVARYRDSLAGPACCRTHGSRVFHMPDRPDKITRGRLTIRIGCKLSSTDAIVVPADVFVLRGIPARQRSGIRRWTVRHWSDAVTINIRANSRRLRDKLISGTGPRWKSSGTHLSAGPFR